MIPRYDLVIDSAIPSNASFWVPSPTDLDENGAPGDFHDTELIVTNLVEAQEVAGAESVAVAYVDAHCATAEEFDDLAGDIEFEVPDFPSDDAPDFVQNGGWDGVNGLELGVAGLVYSLNAAGIVTAASCRSHAESTRPWADYPVVILAADKAQCDFLQPLVERAGCGFEMDSVDRPHLLCIYGPSIVEMMALARAVLAAKTAEGI